VDLARPSLAILLGLIALAAGAPAKASASVAPLLVRAGEVPAATPVGGVARSAPAVFAGAGPLEVSQRWERCTHLRKVLAADAAAHLWPLGDGGETAVAPDLVGARPARHARVPHPAPVDGAVAGSRNGASAFDGARDSLSATGTLDLSGRRPHSFALWVRPGRVEANARHLVARQVRAPLRQGTGLWLSSAGLGFERWTDGVKTGVTHAAGLPAGRWSHVAATYDGAVMRLFVDGRQVGARAAATPLDGAPAALTVGAFDAGSGHFEGALDELALFDRALPRAHVAEHERVARAEPCARIPGAGGSEYTVRPEDVGASLRVVTTVTGPAGSVSSAVDGARPVLDASGNPFRVEVAAPAPGASVSGSAPLTVRVTGILPERVEYAVDGVTRWEEAEAPYSYTWHTGAEVNGAHELGVRAVGPRGGPPATASASVQVANRPAGFAPPLPSGRESMYAEFNQGDLATADNLLDGVWPARGFPLPRLSSPPAWTEDPYGDAYWRFFFYGLRPTANLVWAFETTGDPRYADRLEAILASYVEHDRTRPEDRRTFDNPHAAAYRAMVLVNSHARLRRWGRLSPALDEGLRRSLEKLGAFLEDPRHYESGHNHGFNEAAALLLVADSFPDLPLAARRRALGIERLLQMLDNTVDADGVEVENSPFYHVYVLGLVSQIAAWAERYEPRVARPYREAERKMLRYAAYVTQPDGTLPMLGATATTILPNQDPAIYAPLADLDANFAWVYTRGARGLPPDERAALFPVSGLFLLRSPLPAEAERRDQTFVTFDAGAYRTDHSHLDALSVTVYSHGATQVPEAGLFTYEPGPEYDYFHGTRGHNTVLVDGRDQAEGHARPGGHGTTGDAVWAAGTSRLYAGVEHRRTVVVLRRGLVLVWDSLSGADPHTFTQTWHLPPGTAVEAGPAGRVVGRDARGRAAVAVAQAGGLAPRVVEGATSPMQGWSSSRYGKKVPAPTLEYTRSGVGASFATLVATGPLAAASPTVSSTAIPGARRLVVCAGGAGETITLRGRSGEERVEVEPGGLLRRHAGSLLDRQPAGR
jgi:hypothetical protein